MDNLNSSPPPVISNHQFSSPPSNYHYHQQRNGHQHHPSRHTQIKENISETNYSYSPPQARIAALQEEYLIPMKEDLSDWLKAILDIDDLDANNFMSRLDNGVIVCKLAKLIEEKCDIDYTKLRDTPTSNGTTTNTDRHNNVTSNNNNNTTVTSITQNHVYLNRQNNHLNGNHLNNNINNVINDIKNNNNSDHKANNTLVNNNNNIIYEEVINNSTSPSTNGGGDQGQYRSNTFNHNGRRLSFNYGGSLNGHSPVNGSSSPSSNYSTSSSINGICARTMKCWENAKSETFYARDNVSNFIKWCRKLNVRECVLFESEDLVLHNNPKNVVLCLLEVARIACKKFMFTPAPGLVLFEQEIDAEEKAELEREMIRRRKRHQQQQSIQLMASTTSKPTSSSTCNKTSTTINNNINNNVTSDKPDYSTNDNVTTRNNNNNLKSSSEDNDNNNNANDDGNILIRGYNGDDEDEDYDDDSSSNDEKGPERGDSMDTARGGGQSSSDSGSINTGDDGVDGWSSVSQENLERASSVTSISSTSAESTETQSFKAPFGQESEKVVSQLDQKVMLIAKSYYGKKAKHGIQRLAEGKYRIAGKIVFVRLLKDRHVMVRVGGGWDTLQHFLERHGNGSDPVKEISPSDLLPMDTRPSESMSRRRNSQSSQQSVPSTPILRRCLSSTPVSRSSFSSPEPWTSVGSVTGNGGSGSSSGGNYVTGSPNGSSSSGYNGLMNGCSPYGYRSLARRSSACTTLSNITTASSSTTHSSTSSSSSTINSTEKCVSPVVNNNKVVSSTYHHNNNNNNVIHSSSFTRRRSLAYDGLNNLRNSTIKSNRSMLSLNLTRSPSTSSHLNSSFSSRNFNTSSGNLNTISNGNNTTPIAKTSRYPNYLQSSQHITSKSSNSHHIKSPVTPSSATVPTTSAATSPTTPTSGAAPLRRASLKAF